MYVRASEIPREGLDIVAARGTEWVPRLLEGMSPHPLRECRMLSVALFLSLEGRNLEASGSFLAEGSGECDRCAEPVSVRLEREFRTVYVPMDSGPAGSGDLELRADDLDIAFYDGAGIEVGDIFWEQVGLALPVKVLCGEDCRGVCPRCGADRNREGCSCTAERNEGPFDVLKTLRREKE